jgi:hypothetical protein
MAIVKVNYTRSKAKIKATIRYNAHRPGRGDEKITRTLFGYDGDLSKEEAYELIDAQKGMTYFRLVLNFDPKLEDSRRDLDLRSITKQTILALEERLQRQIGFIAVEHNDHSPLRHIHAIAIVKLGRGEKLTRADFKALRQFATQQALFQQKARDLVRHYQLNRNRSFTQRYIGVAGGRSRRVRRMRKPRQPTIPCPDCGYRQLMVRLKSGKYWCRSCGKVREQSIELSL